jgi:hypothetical protein
MGMICAAQGEHRAASQLLSTSLAHYTNEESQHMLAKEAAVGIAMTK